jgi:hypothetical protein
MRCASILERDTSGEFACSRSEGQVIHCRFVMDKVEPAVRGTV